MPEFKTKCRVTHSDIQFHFLTNVIQDWFLTAERYAAIDLLELYQFISFSFIPYICIFKRKFLSLYFNVFIVGAEVMFLQMDGDEASRFHNFGA